MGTTTLKKLQHFKKTNMQSAKFILFAFIVFMLNASYLAQEKDLSWEELIDHFECPSWFSEARFCIWIFK